VHRERIEEKNSGGGLRVARGRESLPVLLARDAHASHEALEALCDQYLPRIYNYILKRVGGVEDAEDITSIVFEKVILNMDAFDESRASFATWIYRIATNSLTDFYRGKGRRMETFLDDGLRSGVAAVDDSFERAELYRELVGLMKQLPLKCQRAVSLRYFGGLRVHEVAETLGITESAASKRILRGLDELKRRAQGGPLDRIIQE